MATQTRSSPVDGDEGGMNYLERLPRRVVTVYLPLAVFVFVLLFPFYWMAITAIKPNDELTDYKNFSPFWVVRPTLDHIRYLLFETSYPGWLLNTVLISVAATFLSLIASVFAAYAIERLRFKGARITGSPSSWLIWFRRPSSSFPSRSWSSNWGFTIPALR